MSVELGMANQFIRDLSVDTKRGLRAKAERGWYPAPACVGYLNSPHKKKGEREITRDPARFDLVRKLFDLMLTGSHNPPQILKIANEKWCFRMPNGKPLGRSTIYRIFTEPFYSGRFEYPRGSGQWYKGKHDAMITEDEYDEVQVLLGRKGKPRPKNHMFSFTGMITCAECGSMITAEEKIKRQKNGNVHRYIYYHCTKKKNPNCSQKTIRQKVLEEQISDILEKINIPPEFCKWAIDQLRESNGQEAEDRNKILANQGEAYKLCIKKLDNLVEMRVNEEIDQSIFLQKKTALLKEKEHLKELLNDTDGRVNKWIDQAEIVFNFAKVAKTKFENGTKDEKKQILSALGSNLSLKDRELSVSIQKPLLLLEKAAEEVKSIHKGLEPLKSPINTDEIELLYTQNPILLRGWDDFRTQKWLDSVKFPKIMAEQITKLIKN